MLNYQIEPLVNHPEFIPLLAKWHHEQWQHLNPASYDLQARINDYQHATSTNIPAMLVAYKNDQPLGSVRLIEHDMENHPELTPWLASLYVHPDSRGQGIGSSLIQEIEKLAQQLGFMQLYLYTEDKHQLYKRLGWQELFREDYYDQQVIVMSKVIDN